MYKFQSIRQLSLILRHMMPSPSRHAPQQEWHTPMRGVVFQERFQNNKSYRKIENGTEIPFKTGRTKLVQQVLRRYPPPSNAVTLHYCAARESTIKKTFRSLQLLRPENMVFNPSAPLLVMEELIKTTHLTVQIFLP